MARKAVGDKNKREEIIAAALECFFEEGYDGTSIRTIMKKAGAEVGLFYYYFDSKDDVFDKVLEKFFEGYKREFARIADGAQRDPFRALNLFFEYMRTETACFRHKYAKVMHRTVRWAIQEHTLTIIVPYISQILDVLIALGAKPQLERDVAAIMIAHGVGSTILHEDEEWMNRHVEAARMATNLIMGLDAEMADLMFPEFASKEDTLPIVELVEGMKTFFPGFSRKGFQANLEEKIINEEAFVIQHNNQVVGCIGFSRERKEIDFLAVQEEYQKRGVATRLLVTAMAQLPVGEIVSVITFQANDPLGENARRLYRRLGFREEEQTEAFGYPCQRLSRIVPDKVQRGREKRE